MNDCYAAKNELRNFSIKNARNEFDSSIPFDVKDDNLSTQQLDNFFGITDEERESERSARGDTQEVFTENKEKEMIYQ